MMGIKDVFGKVFGVLGGLAPVLGRFADIAGLLGDVIKMAMNSNDVEKMRATILESREMTAALRRLADEIDEGFGSLEQAIDASSSGGDDITASEALAAADEFADIGPAVVALGREADDVVGRLRALLS